MKLAVWTYEGPPHVGAMRVATAMTGVHYVLHAPQGDTYADLLFTMIERRDRRPPVTYTTFQARDLGSDTAELFKTACRDAYARFQPEAMIVCASCTAELIQDDPGGLSRALNLPVPVIPLDLPSYQKREAWGAAETFFQLVKTLASRDEVAPVRLRPSCNILGPTALGFRHRDDVVEVKRILAQLGVDVNVTAPLGATPADLRRLPHADFNVVLYPEIAGVAAGWLGKTFGQPMVNIPPVGLMATRAFIAEVARLAGVDPAPALNDPASRSGWWSRSVDSTYLTNKRVFVFGEANRAIAAATVASEELGFEVVGLGAYNREFAREVRAAAETYGLTALITDDYLEVERAIAEAQPELVLGTQMERHIAKRLRIACAVISAPVHVQDFPARHSPQMGFEGANVLFDTWVHPLVMGLEEHLLAMFRDDFEFNDAAGPSHLGAGHVGTGAPAAPAPVEAPLAAAAASPAASEIVWTHEAQAELSKIPFFVRGKARRNTESFAASQGLAQIHIETLYEARSHFSR
ncbi:ferredoxin:protochlorophyllide reductase (ATP-dependent) subunit B [soil metagenome]